MAEKIRGKIIHHISWLGCCCPIKEQPNNNSTFFLIFFFFFFGENQQLIAETLAFGQHACASSFRNALVYSCLLYAYMHSICDQHLTIIIYTSFFFFFTASKKFDHVVPKCYSDNSCVNCKAWVQPANIYNIVWKIFVPNNIYNLI